MEQVVECLLETYDIAHQGGYLWGDMQHETMACCLFAPTGNELLQQFGKIDLSESQALGTSVESPDIQQGVENIIQPISLRIEHLQHLTLHGQVPAG